MREQVIELARQLQRIDGLVRAKMHDLPGRVHAGVGASGAADVDLAEDLHGRADQMSLHGFRRITLRLPAGVARSLVFDGEFVRRHFGGMRAEG